MGKSIYTVINLTDKFSGKMDAIKAKTLTFENQMSSCNRIANKIDSGFTKAFGVIKKGALVAGGAVAAMGIGSMNTYKDFEQSMSNVAGTMGIDKTSSAYAQLEKAARDAGKATTKTAKESADALNYMGLAGWNVEDSQKGLMPILRASEASGADLATTSDLVTDSMSAYGVKVDNLNGYLDVASKAQQKSNQTMTQYLEAMVGAGGTLKNFNASASESGALLGVLANRGIKGSEAGNSLQSTIINLTKKSGESAQGMKALGIEAYDGQGKFRGLSTVLQDMATVTAGMTDEQRNTYLTMIGGKNQLTTLNALMDGMTTKTADGSTEFANLKKELSNCDGTLEKLSATMTDNVNGSWAIFVSAVDEAKISIAQKLAPYAKQFIDWAAGKVPTVSAKINDFLDKNLPSAVEKVKGTFERLKPSISFTINHFKGIATTAGIVAGALALFSGGVKIVSFFTGLLSVLGKTKNAFGIAKIAMVGLNTSFLACPITWIVAGFVGLVALFAGLYKQSETFRNAIGMLFEKLKIGGQYIRDGIGLALQHIKEKFAETGPAFQNLGNAIGGILLKIGPLVELFAKLVGFRLKVFFEGVGIVIGGFVSVLNGAINICSGFINICKGISKVLSGDVKGGIDLVKTGFGQGLTGAIQVVKGVFDSTFGPIINTLNKINDKVVNIINKLRGVNTENESGETTTAHNATGTTYFRGGWTTVGENGPELMQLPGGTKIYTNNQTKKIMNNNGGYSIVININGDVYGDSDITDRICRKLLDALVTC